MFRSKQAQIMRGMFLIMAMMLNCGTSFAQTPPTATEVFNLRSRCKEIADKKSENFFLGTPETIVVASWTSKYDVKNNRCYVGLFLKRSIPQMSLETEARQVYDGQTDDLLAFTQIKNGKKMGMVSDPDHRKTTDENLGWDDATRYMDELMADKRN